MNEPFMNEDFSKSNNEGEDEFILPLITKENDHRCCICNESFPIINQLNDHLRRHGVESLYTCMFCQQQFARAEPFIIHKRIHVQSLYKNDVKPDITNNSMWNVPESGQEELYRCVFCDKTFADKRKLKVHLAIHTRPFSCDICEKRFSRQYLLKIHMKTHTVVKPIIRRSVEWRFDKERPYVCGLCHKPFLSIDVLNEHLESRSCENDDPSSKGEESTVANTEAACNGDSSMKGEEEFPLNGETCVEVLLSVDNNEVPCQMNPSEDPVVDEPPPPLETLNSNDVELDAGGNDSEIKAEVRYQCQYCEQTFTSKWQRRDHIGKHVNQKRFSCVVCGKKFFRRADCNIHLKIHTGERRFTCDICHKSFFKRWNLKIHKLAHNNTKTLNNRILTQSKAHPFQCEYCDVSYIWRSSLTRHRRIHTGEKPFTCDICHKEFTRSYQAKIHKKAHFKTEKPFKCTTCCTEYSRKESLKIHRKLYHPNEVFHEPTVQKPRVHTCEVCLKTFALKSRWKVHIKMHSDEKPYCCTMCDKSYLYMYGLAMHMSTHTGHKPFHCDKCPMKFSSAGSLKRHVRTHTGELPYSCENCGKMYADNMNLKNHHKKCLAS